MSSSRLVVDAIRDACRGTRYDGVVAGKIATPSLEILVEIEVSSRICRLGFRAENDPPNHAWDPLRRPFEWSRNSMRIPLSMSSYLSRLAVCFALVFQMAGLLAGPHSCRSPWYRCKHFNRTRSNAFSHTRLHNVRIAQQ